MTENTTATAQPAKVHAATWERVNKVNWDVQYHGHSFNGRKVNGAWQLFAWNPVDEDWVEAFNEGSTTLRGFWNDVTEYFKSDSYQAFEYLLDQVNAAAAEETVDDECPVCHKFGDEKCVTSSGKQVKENGGYHKARPGHGA